LLGQFATVGPVAQAQVLRGDPIQLDPGVDIAGLKPGEHAVPRRVGQVLVSAAQQPEELELRVVPAGAVAGALMLDATARVVDRVEPESDDMNRVQHSGRVRQTGAQCGGVAAERIQRGDADTLAPGLGLSLDPLGQNGSRPALDTTSSREPVTSTHACDQLGVVLWRWQTGTPSRPSQATARRSRGRSPRLR